MTTTDKPVGPLDKVHLRLKGVPRLGNAVLETVDTETDLIYGIGSEGITPFETMLFEKTDGNQFSFPVEAGQENVVFGHHQCMLSQALGMAPPYMLHVTIGSVRPASSQEVVKAMAQSAGCGAGCDCGCGCDG